MNRGGPNGFGSSLATTAIADEPGTEGEEIDDARWSGGLPESVFNRELTETVYEQCLRGD